MIAIEQKALQKGFEKEKASYQEFIDRLNAVTLSFVRKTSEKDVIFGSVSSTDIRDALAAQGFEVEKRKIILDEPIKRLGNYTVPIKIFHEERAEVKLEVVKEDELSTREEKDAGPDLVEEGTAASPSGREETKLPVTEEKEEALQERPMGAAAEPESEPVVKEGIQEEPTKILEETKEPPQEKETQDSLVEGQGAVGEKETAEEPSIEEAEIIPSDTPEETLGAQEKEPEERPKESGIIPGKEEVTPEETKSSPEDTPHPSEETKEDSEKTERVAEEPEGSAEEDDSKEAANKNNT
jgi:large subunit ribosomal protein L9